MKLNQLSPHVYWLPPDHTTDRPVLGVITGDNGSLIVDAGNSPAHANILLAEIAAHGLPAPRFAALTHWHWDHVFGLHTLNLPTFAHPETRRKLLEMAQQDWSDEALDQRVENGSEIAFCRDNIKAELPDRSGLIIRPPEIAIHGPVEIDLGGVTAELIPVGGDHAADSVVVYIPEDRVMFIGDCLGEDLYSGPRSYTTYKLFPLIDHLLIRDVQYYLEGHAPEPILRRSLEDDLALLKLIGRTVDQVGHDPLKISSVLQDELKITLNEEHLEIIQSFLAGLQKNVRQEKRSWSIELI